MVLEGVKKVLWGEHPLWDW